MDFLIFAAGVVVLILGADWLVGGSASLAKRFNIPEIAIGLTVVAFGTSMPELVVNIFASLQGNADIAIGNVLGSNIFNILLVLGVSSLIRPVVIKANTVYKETPFSLFAVVLLLILAGDTYIDGESQAILSRSDGIVLLIFFMAFLYYIFWLVKNDPDPEITHTKQFGMPKTFVLILTGLGLLVLGGKLCVQGAIGIAEMLGVSDSFIGLTVVAAGTSLPELATSAVAAYRKKNDIAVGNIVGSNIFNIFLILGTSSVINPIPFSSSGILYAIFTMLATLLLIGIVLLGRKKFTLNRLEGFIFLTAYLGFIAFLLWQESAK